MMQIQVRLFAVLKQYSPTAVVELELPQGASVADAVDELARVVGAGDALRRLPLGHAVNREYVAVDTALSDGDELALIPPVSGGAPEARVHAAIVERAPSADQLTEFVADPAAGAVVVFHGVTREVDRLEYEAYVEMAEPLLAGLLAAVAAEHELCALACEHRVGTVPLGQPSVVVAASAPHRAEAFAGARAAIDRIKLELPVWKREVVQGGGATTKTWVAGQPIGQVLP